VKIKQTLELSILLYIPYGYYKCNTEYGFTHSECNLRIMHIY